MLITAASVDGGGSGGSVYESDGGWERYGPRIGHLDHEPVVGGSGVDLGYKEEELGCRNLEVEAEVRKLEETLEYQRMIENQAKQKHLAESIYWQVPLSQRQGNGFCNGAGHVPGETGDEASQKISVTHNNCLSIGVGDNGSEGFNRRTGRIGKREKYPNEVVEGKYQYLQFGQIKLDDILHALLFARWMEEKCKSVSLEPLEYIEDKMSYGWRRSAIAAALASRPEIETQGLQHRDTDYREFSQSHTPTKAASTSKDTIAPRDRSKFRLESQLHVWKLILLKLKMIYYHLTSRVFGTFDNLVGISGTFGNVVYGY
ncbi:hypothetical protein POM88_001515 [Heracleum sosnowskyi]|uniref:Uncharacterized protein n=1 Tax=Heracleum sosnowskyi TaxID=360622 RepID=A0AAD8N522_9APIA|nr:hypothetical protein POM88_001515 [Heracleum sosnowskyi]